MALQCLSPRLPCEVSQAFTDASHVRGSGLGETALPRGNSILPRRFESLRLALALTLYQKSGLLTEISRRDISAAGLSGLSLPDAHTPLRTQRLCASALKTPLLFLLIFVAEQFAPQPNPHVAISELEC